MSNYSLVKLKDLIINITDNRGKTPPLVESGIELIETPSLRGDNKYVDFSKINKYVSQETYETWFRSGHPKNGDILITLVGTIGKVCIFKDNRGCIAQNIVALEFNEYCNSEFMYYYLSSPIMQNQISFLNRQSAQPNLKVPDFINLAVSLPPLKEQQKIAEILSSVDAAIEKTEQVIAKTEEVKKGLMQQLLTKGIGHTEFKQTEIGEIPLEWEVVSIESFSTVIRGASPRPKGDPRYYGGNVPRLMGADVTRDKKYVTPKIDFLTEEGAKLSRQMSKGDFVIVCSGTVGLPAILAIDACIHDGFLALKDINPKVSKEYLYYIFTQLRQQLDSKATHGGVFTNLTTQIVKEFKIALPSIDEQENISNILKGIDDKIDLEQKHMDKLSDIKKGLMQQLLTGKTRVKID